jgi:drug/metabolite transporter (DMT)-like permease
MAPKPKAVIFLVGATLCWAGNYVVGAAAVRGMSPLSLVYLRWVIAAAPLVLIAQWLERPAWSCVLRRWPVLLVLAMLGLAAYTSLVYHALRYTSPLNAALINSFNPALIVVAAAVFLRERVGWRGVAGLVLGLAGVVLVLTNGRPLAVLSLRFNTGDLLMLVAIVCWTAYTILGRRLRGVPPIAATAVQAVLAVIVLTPVALVVGVRLPPTREAALSLAFIAVFPSVVAYVLWNSALAVIDPGRAAVFLNLITVFTAAASLIAGKPVTLPQVVGGALVLAGVYFTSRTAARDTSREASREAPRQDAKFAKSAKKKEG